MIEGFVSLYTEEGKSKLYFFPGIDDTGKQMYMTLDMSNISANYTFVKNEDKSIVYTFDTVVTKVTANLINRRTGETHYMTIQA